MLPTYFSSVVSPRIPHGSLRITIGVQDRPAGDPLARVIGQAAPAGWLGGVEDMRGGKAEQVWRLTIKGAAGVDGPAGMERAAGAGLDVVGWVLRGGVWVELGDAAEWGRGW